MPAPARTASATRVQSCAELARLLGLRSGAGAAVLYRRDHGAAAGRTHRRAGCRLPGGSARGQLARRRRGDHDDRYRAQGGIAARHVGRRAVTVTGIAKGAGMIHPDMATMLGFVATDARVAQPLRAAALREPQSRSFNCITVDGDTSTNDAFMLIATGRAAMQRDHREPTAPSTSRSRRA